MKIIKGDLLDMADQGLFDIIVHGCNCFNTMGSGIAHQIATRYPAACDADAATKQGDYKVGTYTSALIVTKTNPPKVFTIINAYTQYGFNRGSYDQDLFEYEGFDKILKKLALCHGLDGKARIGFPLIGCERAGGDRTKIMKIIEDNIPDATIVEWAMINN